MDNLVIRGTHPHSYGVTLFYSDDGKRVTASSHIPHTWVTTQCLHYGLNIPREASPVENEFIEYYSAMECTLAKIDEEIAALQDVRGKLAAHLEASMAECEIVREPL